MRANAPASTDYKRLPGRGPRIRRLAALGSRCRLYLAVDHVLSVDNNGFSEEYKRFYFSDILAITTCKDRRWAGWMLVLPFLTLFSGAGALWAGRGTGAVFLMAFCGVFLLCLLLHIVRGPTCICDIMTAVQKERLPSLNRVRTARKVIRLLEEGIARVQGTIGPEEFAARLEAEPVAVPSPLSTRPAEGQGLRHYGGTAHGFAFSLLALDGFVGVWSLIHHHRILALVSIFLTMAYSLFIVIALAKQQGSNLPRRVRRTAWVSVVFVWVSIFLSSVNGFIYSARFMHTMTDQWAIYRAMLDIPPQQSLYLTILTLCSVAASFLLAAIGLTGVMQHRRSSFLAATPSDTAAEASLIKDGPQG
jgi:hypothetical protein